MRAVCGLTMVRLVRGAVPDVALKDYNRSIMGGVSYGLSSVISGLRLTPSQSDRVTPIALN